MEMKTVVYKREPLGNQRFQWRQREFLLGTANCVGLNAEKAIQNCVEAGFNQAGLSWVNGEQTIEKIMDLCEKYGLNLEYSDFYTLGGMMGKFLKRPVEDETILRLATKIKEKKHTVGFMVWDEPYDDIMFAEARRQSDLIESVYPEALLYTVFPPSYNPGPTWENGLYAERFEEYVKRLDPPVISMDHYPIGDYFGLYSGFSYDNEKQLDNAVLWCDLAVERKLSLKYRMPFWFCYQGCRLYEVTEKLYFSQIRMMAFSAVLYGAKGLRQYASVRANGIMCIGDLVITPEGEKGVYFEEQKQLHKELKNLGKTLMALSSTHVFHSEDVCLDGIYQEIFERLHESVKESTILQEKLPNRVSAGEFRDESGTTYLMILNRDFYCRKTIEIKLKGRKNIYLVSKVTGKQQLIRQNTDKLYIQLEPGDAELFRVQPETEEIFRIEYELKGEV